MKQLIFLSLLALCGSQVFAQEGEEQPDVKVDLNVEKKVANPIPNVAVQSLEGKKIATGDFSNNGKPMVIDFWATWCKPCIKELNAINENYPEWQAKTGVKIITISVDDERTISKVAPFVNTVGWEYENYLDPNSEFKRAMNVVNVPHLFVIDGQGNIVSQHTSYAPGDEEQLLEELLKLSKNSKQVESMSPQSEK